MADVTIPAEAAKAMAAYHRGISATTSEEHPVSWHRGVADLLDPQPTLAQRIDAAVQAEWERTGIWPTGARRAVLAEVRDAVEALRHSHGFFDPDCSWCTHRRAVFTLIDEAAQA